ncbi:MAG: tRNA (adenosine(37)-N6)-threonylcarbamoyltransferase complex dimerization subunit type 1 TsaB [Sphingobium sp. 32-64-5]|nr:MAG: tRNA (adenosine(37)-N6)-threonylcarbamoyltransferase complex dimerization subunit type 1 TsaB [Sphingobium sp. 32-64-5]
MRRLIIDTATEALSVALFDDGVLMDYHHEIYGRGHAEKLVPVIAEMGGGGRADEIVVDKGPGSFTGVRVGLAAARALAYGWNAGLRAYESLSLVAAMAARRDAETGDRSATIAVSMTGGHGECFWQIFDRATLTPLTGVTSTPIASLARELDAPILYGTGAAVVVEARGHGRAIPLHPDARCLPLLPDPLLSDDPTPLYGRGADAMPLAARENR